MLRIKRLRAMKIKRWHGLMVWLVTTLAAIALIGDAVYVGLGIALLGGVACGFLYWLAAREL